MFHFFRGPSSDIQLKTIKIITSCRHKAINGGIEARYCQNMLRALGTSGTLSLMDSNRKTLPAKNNFFDLVPL